MEDIVKINAGKIAKFIDEHKGENTTVLYLGEQVFWTDYFIITTVNSRAHINGLLKNLKEYLPSIQIKPLNMNKALDSESWVLVDCANIIIHLMNNEARNFYDLENLWFNSKRIDYSSNSS